MFALSSTALDTAAYREHCRDPRAGALATFEGWVRDQNEGRAVLSLNYEAHPVLAVSEGRAILEEALRRHDILQAYCAHRTGRLVVGDLAVWVGVSAAHRGPAFDAVRYIIDEVKARVPIWKKEFYVDGESAWVGCEHCGGHTPGKP